jgi:hypothetical protein
MGKSPSPSPGQDWPHEGCCGNILASRDSWKQPEARARQRYREVAPCCHARKCTISPFSYISNPSSQACFPHDVEICTGRSQPHCVHHSFVLQQDSSHTLYGIALRVWSRADEKRAETIRDLRKRIEPDFFDNPDETYWIPYCLSFLSRYPLYNLLGDYLRGMWIHWNKATNLFHAEEVSRILSFPAPRLNDLVRIDMKDYALCYQFPSSPTGFQNFAMWPLFTCLSIPNIVGVIEAAVSPTRRIIFTSHYPAMLTIAAETVRFCVRVYEWSGLYVPVVHARHVKDLVQEPGPYILGVTSECRSLFTAPTDALVVDLDRNFVLTSSPPSALTAGQRSKMITRLTQALNGEVSPTGVPQHLRSAYGGGKLIPAGQIIVMRGEVESIQDPDWWTQDAVMSVMDHVCEKLVCISAAQSPFGHKANNVLQGRNTGVKAIFGGSVKKPLMTKVSMRHLNEIVRERNQYSRDAQEAWQDFINLKGRMDTELSKVSKRNNFLVEELESWKQQFLKFQAFAEQLTKETQDLKVKIENHKRENRRLTNLIDQQKDDAARLTIRLSGTEKQRDDALEALVLQQEIAEELERERKRNKKELGALQHTNGAIQRQRDEAQRVVLHLRALIEGQTHHMEHIVKSLNHEDMSGYLEQGFEDVPEEDESEIFDDADVQVAVRDKSEVGTIRGVAGVESTSASRASTAQAHHLEGEDVTPDMEQHLHRSPARNSKRFSNQSMVDVADRVLRDKTDAIAYIIRNISEQCAAAVEGLQLAQRADTEDGDNQSDRRSSMGQMSSFGGRAQSTQGSEYGDEDMLRPGRGSSIPPTPDLSHRSSTSMSMASASTTPDRTSLQHRSHDIPVVPTRILEHEDDVEDNSDLQADMLPVSKYATPLQRMGQNLRTAH